MITGAPYRVYLFGLSLGELPGRLSAWAGLFVQQFGWPGVALILLGLWDMLAAGPKGDQTHARWVWGLILAFVLYTVYALGYRTEDSYVYLIPAYMVAALWLGRGMYVVVDVVRGWGAERGESPRLRLLIAPGMAALLALLPAWQLASNWQAMDVSGDATARSYVEDAVTSLPAHALVITASDEHTFALWYAQAVNGRTDVLVVDRDLTQFLWYREQIRRHAPDLEAVADNDVPAEYVPALVQAASKQRAVFLADVDATLQQQFAWQRRGDMQILVRQ